MERMKTDSIMLRMEEENIPLSINTKYGCIYVFYIYNRHTIQLKTLGTDGGIYIDFRDNQEETITRILQRLEHGTMYSITTFMELMRLFGK